MILLNDHEFQEMRYNTRSFKCMIFKMTITSQLRNTLVIVWYLLYMQLNLGENSRSCAVTSLCSWVIYLRESSVAFTDSRLSSV